MIFQLIILSFWLCFMFFNKGVFLFLIIASAKYHHPRVKFVSLGAEPVVPRIEETILEQASDEMARLSPMKTTAASSLAAPSPTAYSMPQPFSPHPVACKCQPVDEINTRIDQLSRWDKLFKVCWSHSGTFRCCLLYSHYFSVSNTFYTLSSKTLVIC